MEGSAQRIFSLERFWKGSEFDTRMLCETNEMELYLLGERNDKRHKNSWVSNLVFGVFF